MKNVNHRIGFINKKYIGSIFYSSLIKVVNNDIIINKTVNYIGSAGIRSLRVNMTRTSSNTAKGILIYIS